MIISKSGTATNKTEDTDGNDFQKGHAISKDHRIIIAMVMKKM